MDLVAAWKPSALALTHFGTYDDVDAHLERLRAELDCSRASSRSSPMRTASSAALRASATPRGPGDAAFDGRRGASRTAVAGLDRYWRKKAEREAASDDRATIRP